MQIEKENNKRLEERIVDGSLIKEIIPVLLNPQNEDLWKDRPHLNWKGLVVAFEVPLKVSLEPVHLTVSHQMLEIWDIMEEELFQKVVNNRAFLDSTIIRTLDENLKLDHGIESGFPKPESKHEMYIITTKDHYYGAGAVLNTDAMESLADRVGTDLYLLPASVHEFMAASCEGYTAVEMKNLLYEFNLIGDKEEQLSNHLFFYDRKDRSIGLAVDKIKEQKTQALTGDGKQEQIKEDIESVTPDDFLTGERIETPRGSFSLTTMTREQMAAAGYGFHHSSDDGRYHIVGNGTRAFAIINEEARTLERTQVITDTIMAQILEIRDSGLTNMLDAFAVQRIAFQNDQFELVDLITEDKGAYVQFIFNGDRGERKPAVEKKQDGKVR